MYEVRAKCVNRAVENVPRANIHMQSQTMEKRTSMEQTRLASGVRAYHHLQSARLHMNFKVNSHRCATLYSTKEALRKSASSSNVPKAGTGQTQKLHERSCELRSKQLTIIINIHGYWLRGLHTKSVHVVHLLKFHLPATQVVSPKRLKARGREANPSTA